MLVRQIRQGAIYGVLCDLDLFGLVLEHGDVGIGLSVDLGQVLAELLGDLGMFLDSSLLDLDRTLRRSCDLQSCGETFGGTTPAQDGAATMNRNASDNPKFLRFGF